MGWDQAYLIGVVYDSLLKVTVASRGGLMHDPMPVAFTGFNGRWR